MTITRTKRTTDAKRVAAELTAEQFIDQASPPPPLPAGPPASTRADTALAVVKAHLPWAAAAGVLPLPGIDLAAIVGTQLRMLAKMAEIYGISFREQAAKSIVATLMATVLENTVAGGLGSLLKLVPGIGTVLGVAALPALASAGTYAVGKVFITHFEAGGTFLDLDPQKVRQHFHAEFVRARDTARLEDV